MARFNGWKMNQYLMSIWALLLWSTQMIQIEGNPIINIDCDCSSTSFESDPAACCINEMPDFDESSIFKFINSVNASWTPQKTTQIKIHSKKNFTSIPRQIIDSFENAVYLEVSMGLQTIPRLPNGLMDLNLGYNRINTIESDAFQNHGTHLVHINLQSNGIVNIAETNAFAGLSKLIALNLSHNKLTIIHRTTFTGANNLQDIDLSENEITTIEDGAFDLPHLKEILISDNKLKHLSDNIFAGAPNLQNIDLQRNQLEFIGKAFEHTQHLHQLQLSGNNQLKDLNVLSLSHLPNLISLSLDAIGMHTLAPSTSSSPSATTSTQSPLHTLSLSQNSLSSTDFLKQLSIFSKIEKLFVDANKFVRWDDADVQNIKKYFPHIELIVTKNNIWDRRWVENSLIPVFQANNIFCSNIKYLNIYIEGFTNSVDGQIIEGTECI